jgi:hypothetical protein
MRSGHLPQALPRLEPVQRTSAVSGRRLRHSCATLSCCCRCSLSRFTASRRSSANQASLHARQQKRLRSEYGANSSSHHWHRFMRAILQFLSLVVTRLLYHNSGRNAMMSMACNARRARVFRWKRPNKNDLWGANFGRSKKGPEAVCSGGLGRKIILRSGRSVRVCNRKPITFGYRRP